MEQKLGFPTFEHLGRFDGSTWRIFNFGDGFLVVTERGHKVLPEYREILRGYRDEAGNGISDFYRNWFRSGGNSDVYTVGKTSVVVKETSTSHSAYLALDRMDYLHNICAQCMPSHIQVPEQYAVLSSRQLRRQYLIMQRVNDGLTVEDVLVHQGISNHHRSLVVSQYERAQIELNQRIKDCNVGQEAGRNLLPDWHPGNVIVDFDSPIGHYPFTLWITDQ